MAEFKITHLLTEEVVGIQECGEAINNDYSSLSDDYVDSLPTAKGYIAQHQAIKDVLDLYESLVTKDVADLLTMITEANEMDAKLGVFIK